MPKNAEAIAGDIAGAPGSAKYRRRGPVKRTPVHPHGPGVKWPRLYRKFRRKGWTKEKAARVSNEMYNKIKSGRYKRRKPRPPFPGVGGVYPGGNPTALARGISSDMARYGRVHPKTTRAGVGKRDTVEKGRGGLGRWFNEKWVDISRPLPEGGFAPCGRKDASKGSYPKCVPEAVALKMSQKEIDSAVRRKRRAEASQDREGKKPINVSTFEKSRNVPVDAALYARVKAEAKRKFDVYPSAYANGWLVQEYKRRGGKYRVEKARVRTLAGVKRYGLPLGSLIVSDVPKPSRKAVPIRPTGDARNRSKKRLAMFQRGGMSGSNTPEALAAAIIENGGITYNPKRNERRSTGVAVAIDKQHEAKFPIDDFVDRGADHIRDYVKRHEELLAQPRVHLGAWDDDGFIYLDLSVVTSDLDEAADIGREHDQIGMFHLSTFSDWKRIPVNGQFRYVPVNSDDAEAFDDLVDLTPAMFTLLETISKASQKRLTSKPVIFISGADIDEDTIPKIVAEISRRIVKKNQPGASDVHVDRPIGSNKYKDPKGGLTAAGRSKFKRETGANLKPGVKNYNDASLADKKRWISWASRFYGRSTYPPLKDAKGRPTRFALTAAAWGEPVPSTEQEARKIAAKARARSAELAKRDFTDDQRAKLAEEGKAQPDGSYPIVNREDLRNAMRAIGRSKNRALTIRHIKRRAKEMGVSNLPEWIDGNA